MGLILSLVSTSLHILIVGDESRLADVLCQTALKYAQNGVIHRQQYPLTLASMGRNKHRYFIVTGTDQLIVDGSRMFYSYLAGSIAIGNDGITYLESIDNLSKNQVKQLISGLIMTAFYADV